MIIRTQNPRTPIESTNATSCVNIFAPFRVCENRDRVFSVTFFGFYGGAGVLCFGQKCKKVHLYVPSSVGTCSGSARTRPHRSVFSGSARANSVFAKPRGPRQESAPKPRDFNFFSEHKCNSLVITKFALVKNQIPMVFYKMETCVFFCTVTSPLGSLPWVLSLGFSLTGFP